jgi:hypothetical protein
MKVLEMLEEGKISADEASALLAAVGEERAAEPVTPVEQSNATERGPDMDHFRRISQIPLLISSSILTLLGAGLYTLYRYSGGEARCCVSGPSLGLLCWRRCCPSSLYARPGCTSALRSGMERKSRSACLFRACCSA